MADEADPETGAEQDAPKKKSKKGLLIGVVLALILGGGGFYAVYSGLVLGESGGNAHGDASDVPVADLPHVAFVPIDPLVISLGPGSPNRHLRFRAQLEVVPEYQADVVALIPRVLDVLNSYLRAVEISDIEAPSALINLRAQMLRRIQLVTGQGRVRDLLIMEFVLN